MILERKVFILRLQYKIDSEGYYTGKVETSHLFSQNLNRTDVAKADEKKTE